MSKIVLRGVLFEQPIWWQFIWQP